ncbi:MAG TPA: ACT domain-containing protein [Nevskiaceae bacterium]|nr:ACT domain-containing protein [Nevskiaceae bacterium]
MATIRKVDYFVLHAPNRPGQGARLMRALKERKVNLLAMSAFPDERGSQVDLVPESAAELKAAARAIGVDLEGAKKGFLVHGKDRVGVLTKILDKLGAAKINVTAIDAVSTGKKFGAIFWVKPADVLRAAKVLGAK